MHYRRYGRTELEMPVLTCGGMRFQKAWTPDADIDEENQQNVEATVRRALGDRYQASSSVLSKGVRSSRARSNSSLSMAISCTRFF